jgi:hypothetical protein
METQIVIFLAFVSVTVITNALLMFFAYKAVAGVASKVTEAVVEFETSIQTREWIAMLQSASEQAITVTEATKVKIAQVEPALANVQQRYQQALSTIDSKLETAADEITINARKVRDAVATPAFSIVTFAAGISSVLESIENDE